MGDDQHKPGKPIWEKFERERKPDPAQCQSGNHTWQARFYISGRLAYWACADCGKMDRVMTRLPEYLDSINGWIEFPPRLIVRGPNPPVLGSRRQWITKEGTTLHEGEPSSIYHVGLEIPELDDAHTYTLYDANGNVVTTYEPSRWRMGKHSDHYWLTRYQVIDSALVQFISHCFEESTYDSPSTSTPKLKTMLSGLRLLAK